MIIMTCLVILLTGEYETVGRNAGTVAAASIVPRRCELPRERERKKESEDLESEERICEGYEGTGSEGRAPAAGGRRSGVATAGGETERVGRRRHRRWA